MERFVPGRGLYGRIEVSTSKNSITIEAWQCCQNFGPNMTISKHQAVQLHEILSDWLKTYQPR